MILQKFKNEVYNFVEINIDIGRFNAQENIDNYCQVRRLNLLQSNWLNYDCEACEKRN